MDIFCINRKYRYFQKFLVYLRRVHGNVKRILFDVINLVKKKKFKALDFDKCVVCQKEDQKKVLFSLLARKVLIMSLLRAG